MRGSNLELDLKGVPESHYKVYVRPIISHYNPFQLDNSRMAMGENLSLFTRAWCYQERVLATRILHYTPEEMVFECRTGLVCECGEYDGTRPYVKARLSSLVSTSSTSTISHPSPQHAL